MYGRLKRGVAGIEAGSRGSAWWYGTLGRARAWDEWTQEHGAGGRASLRRSWPSALVVVCGWRVRWERASPEDHALFSMVSTFNSLVGWVGSGMTPDNTLTPVRNRSPIVGGKKIMGCSRLTYPTLVQLSVNWAGEIQNTCQVWTNKGGKRGGGVEEGRGKKSLLGGWCCRDWGRCFEGYRPPTDYAL